MFLLNIVLVCVGSLLENYKCKIEFYVLWLYSFFFFFLNYHLLIKIYPVEIVFLCSNSYDFT